MSSPADIEWAKAFINIRPYVFKIETPRGSGSGFLITIRKNGIMGIATAAHVIDHEDDWEEPIKICHAATNKRIVVKAGNRAILRDDSRDAALLVCNLSELQLPKTELRLAPEKKALKVGIEIGWVGFPCVAPDSLSFFSGRISSHESKNHAYLIDGVAINGVSGGPAFICSQSSDIHFVGVVTAYIPNRSTGETLPGVCFVQGVEPFYDFIKSVKSLEEAQEKVEAQKNQPSSDGTDTQSTPQQSK